ncbi:16S rRNA (uracil(1498)-N(3))-methyltransferase [Deferribacterales bacterium RsTz2092]|nr:ribosomal RNA small subunit methyltransferase E [Deferribacterales bacterium]
MKRIYLPIGIDIVADGDVAITDANAHYITKVLRLNIGDELEVLMPTKLVRVKIVAQDKREVVVRATSARDIIVPDYSFCVYQCLLKREYMDTVVEKLTEIGATKIVPVISKHSGALKENALKRYKSIAVAATLQSEREQPPEIADDMPISDIAIESGGNNILFYERAPVKTPPVVTSRNINIVIGPEGGFTDDEALMLANKGFDIVSPVSNILKAETAAIVFAGLVMSALETSG